jgi:hypothetical protein
MKTSGVLFLGLIIAGLSFYGGLRSAQKNQNQQMEQMRSELQAKHEQEFAQFKEPFQSLSAEEVREYLKTQNAEEKLKKADEILAKIMKIFVAQLGLKLGQEEVQNWPALPQSTQNNQPPPAPIPTKREEVAEAPVKNSTEDEQLNRRLRNRAQSVRTAGEIDRFAKMLGNNFSERVQDSKSISRQQLQFLNGFFEGEVRLDQKKIIYPVMLEFAGSWVKAGYVDGKFSLKILDENQKEMSSTSGQGNLSKSLSGNENEIFIESGRHVLQLTYFPQIETWGGTYLESDKGRYQRLGSVQLKRK